MKRHCRLREGGREGVWMSKFQIRSLREGGKIEVAARACCGNQIHPEGLKITHDERGEVGEHFVEKMVSFDGSPRGLPPSSQTSAGFSARVRHERADGCALAIPGNRTKGTFRSLNSLSKTKTHRRISSFFCPTPLAVILPFHSSSSFG